MHTQLIVNTLFIVASISLLSVLASASAVHPTLPLIRLDIPLAHIIASDCTEDQGLVAFFPKISIVNCEILLCSGISHRYAFNLHSQPKIHWRFGINAEAQYLTQKLGFLAS